MRRIERPSIRTLSWWLAALTLALLLKQHYSTATTTQLDWMLQPLADLLQLVSGHGFQRADDGVWFSTSADVQLVKGCAGINFMLMSLLGYVWLLRPDSCDETGRWSWLAGQVLLLAAALVAAWATALLANTLRILAAMALQTDGSMFHAIGLDGASLHRLIGLTIYLPLLSAQLTLGQRTTSKQRVLIPVLLYLLLMILIPLLTGNAWQNPQLFAKHLGQLLIGLMLWYGLSLLLRGVRSIDRSRASTHRHGSSGPS